MSHLKGLQTRLTLGIIQILMWAALSSLHADTSGLLSRGPLFALTCHDKIFSFSFALKTSSLSIMRGLC